MNVWLTALVVFASLASLLITIVFALDSDAGVREAEMSTDEKTVWRGNGHGTLLATARALDAKQATDALSAPAFAIELKDSACARRNVVNHTPAGLTVEADDGWIRVAGEPDVYTPSSPGLDKWFLRPGEGVTLLARKDTRDELVVGRSAPPGVGGLRVPDDTREHISIWYGGTITRTRQTLAQTVHLGPASAAARDGVPLTLVCPSTAVDAWSVRVWPGDDIRALATPAVPGALSLMIAPGNEVTLFPMGTSWFQA
jgi:hypothetical protein